MKTIFDLNHLGDIPVFSPPHHTKTADRKLVHDQMGAKAMAIWSGEIEPGGVADEHLHEEMEQAFYILDGECDFKLGEETKRLGPGHLIYIHTKVPHRVTSVGKATLKLLIIMAPPPSSLEAWQKK
jgi:quercetin dioxygenase-like cupin family protein